MGQTTSTGSQPEPHLENQLDRVLRIDSAEKFQTYFSHDFRHECLSLSERSELREAFGFSIDTEFDFSEGRIFWNKDALIDFLSAAVPVELKADLSIAGPLLLKAMIRLGFFPFHNRQTPSTLGADEAFLAIIFLLRMHEGYSGFSFDDIYDDHEQTQQFCDRWFHRLLFQVMSNKPDLDSQHESQEQDKLSTRDPADDEDLILTRKYLEKNNYTRDERRPKVRINLPPVIEVSELPSSKSHDMTGTVPREEFHALLNMLCGLANHTLVDVSQLLETHSTDWQGFEAILAKLEPHFSSGLRQLFDPFIHFYDWLRKSGRLEDQGV